MFIIKKWIMRDPLTIIKRSIKQNNNSSMAFHNLANTQRSMGMYKEAIIFYKNALEIKPEQIESINALGLTYYDVFENKSGIECFKSILEIDKKIILQKEI